MITFKQYILEYAQVNIPPDGRTAPTRYNNPGGAYPFKGSDKFGLKGVGTIGGGHKIGYYPTPAHGVAANIAHLRSMPVVGKTVGQARHYWHYGNFGGVENLQGMDNSQVITGDMLKDQNWLAKWMVATAKMEGYRGPLDKNVFDEAFKLLDGSSNYDPSKVPDYKPGEGGTSPGQAPEDGTPESTDDGGFEKKDYSSISGMLADLGSALSVFKNYGPSL